MTQLAPSLSIRSVRENIFGFLSRFEVFCICCRISKSWRITRASWPTLEVFAKDRETAKLITIINKSITKTISKLILFGNGIVDKSLYHVKCLTQLQNLGLS